MAASLTRIRADSAWLDLDLAESHDTTAAHARRRAKTVALTLSMNSTSIVILDDKIGGSLRIVPGEMNTLRREINGFEGFDRLSGRQPFLTALDCPLQCNIEWTLDPSG